jgi:hypothetical protein
MSKLATILSAATFALACSGIATAADQAQTQEPTSDKSGDYVAELKKCESLSGEVRTDVSAAPHCAACAKGGSNLLPPLSSCASLRMSRRARFDG